MGFRGAHRTGRSLALSAIVVVAGSVAAAGVAQAKAHYLSGYYSGRTSQGKTISLFVEPGTVSGLLTQMVDDCHPGFFYDNLYPHPASIDSRGNWFHRIGPVHSREPTVFHGHLSAGRASGTIDDVIYNNRGRRCHSRVSFRAMHQSPGRVLKIDSATVSGRGADVRVRLVAPITTDGAPDTSAALLIYGSDNGCRTTYQAAEAQSVSGQPAGFISNAYVTADVANPPFGDPATYGHGAFTFDVTTNTVILTATGSSPFSTACVMLYSGRPGTLTPADNAALVTIQAPLRPGAGPPDNQP